MKINLTSKTRNELWWLIISVDYDYSRIVIAEHEFTSEGLTLYIEDKENIKQQTDDCLQIFIPAKQLKAFIKDGKYNSYKGTKMHPEKKFVYDIDIEINSPIRWYEQDATSVEQRWLREALLKSVIDQLIENDVPTLQNV